jgi:tripartite-type tricarboxylate transporter receptor subunit TctC
MSQKTAAQQAGFATMRFKLLIAAVATVLAGPLQAQDTFPSRPITLIIPFAPGGGSDVIARIVGEEIGKSIGQPIVFENVAGAGGTTGLARTASAKPDGHTIVIGNAGNAAAAYTIYPDLKYKADAFEPLGLIARTASIVALKKDFAATSVADFIALAKTAPESIRLGHAGVGSSNYLICLSFLKAIGLDLTLVSYRGASPALNDVMGGHIDGVCDNAASVTPSILGSQVKGLVVAGNAKLGPLPNLPHAIEAGIPEFQAGGWNGFFAPAGTPQPIVAAWNTAIRKALASDFVKGRFNDIVSTVPTADEQTPAFQKDYVGKEIERYKALLATAKK